MYKNIKVEAEHNELILENSHGDKVIIPANKRNWVKQKLSEGCHSCIDSLVETLPIASQYAQDGSVYPPNKKVKVNQDNQIKEYDISSPEYRDLYNTGKLMNYDKNTDTYIAAPLKEVIIKTKAPQWLKYKREYEKNNPKSDYINQYLKPFARSLGNTETNYPKRLDNEYEEKSLNYASEQLVKNKPQGKLNRTEWLNQMSDKEEELIKRNPKYQSSLWADTKRGLTSLVEQNPLQTFQNILNSSDYTNREKQEMLKDYADHPVMSKLGDVTKILNPLTVPSKMVQSAYKDNYSFTDALKGKKNNAGIVEDIVTDPLNLVGVGLAGKLSKADKIIDATKAGSKVLNKLDDVIKNSSKFKSEINWGKWNPEIPNNTKLMQEYNAIEQTSKANGTWMKNPDGSPFQGTPEQFVQQNSSNFKKAFPEGSENVFRGTGENIAELRPNRSIFTANQELASGYAPFNKKSNFLNSESVEGGVHSFYRKNSKNSLELDANNTSWTSVDLSNKRLTKDYFERNIKSQEGQITKQKEYLSKMKQKPNGSWEAPDGTTYSNDLYKNTIAERELYLKDLKERYKNIDNLISNPKELEEMRKVLGNTTTTDNIAAYVEKRNLDYVKLKNIEDSGVGDVTIVNHKPGNYLKSAVGNNGMFDMTNPNIYKGIIPPALLLYLQSQNQQNKSEQ